MTRAQRANSKAISELASMGDSKKPKMNIPNEPGNRDARRNAGMCVFRMSLETAQT